MHNSWHSDLKFFSTEECALLAKAFDDHGDYLYEDGQPFYKNSYGAFNLPASLQFTDRIAANLKKKYPRIKFANSYMRSYGRGSYLKPHTDRKGLDISVSICIEDKNNLDWPLCISAKKYFKDDWDLSTDIKPYEENYLEAHMGVGYGALMLGRTYPHWREELLCGEKQRALYIFYHFTLEEEDQVVLKIDYPDLVLYRDFIYKTEAEELINLAKNRLEKSKVVDANDGGYILSDTRTSSVAYFQRGETPLISKIEEKIAVLTGTDIDQGEGLQVLKYEVGQEFKPHYDYFPDIGKPYEQKDKGGQRMITALLYLHEPSSGGETTFPEAGITVKSVVGNLLTFKYEDLSVDTKTLHCGMPVLEGEKWVATKWIRKETFK